MVILRNETDESSRYSTKYNMSLTLLQKAEQFCRAIFREHIPEEFVYHNLNHTERVVKATEVIGVENGLKEDDLEILKIAAWFHDVGYSKGCDQHEESGAKIAEEFLNKHGYSKDKTQKVLDCILATKMPQAPKDLMEEVLCDADMYHLACSDYDEMSERMHKEIEKVNDKKINISAWNEMNFKFFKDHEYFTPYARKFLQPIKEHNLKGISKVKQVKEAQQSDIEKLEKKLAKEKKKRKLRPDRGIETMFRTTSKNHLELSAMADNKANIMISVNTIILTVVVSVLLRKLTEYPNLVIPAILLIVVCLTTIVLAILATRPNVSSGVFTNDEVMSKKTNLLFFGNFHKMDLKNYDWGMREMMKDGDYLYGSLIKDIYYLGVVLGRKYKLLRACYTFFMIGFVISIISFVVAMLVFPPTDQGGFYTF